MRGPLLSLGITGAVGALCLLLVVGAAAVALIEDLGEFEGGEVETVVGGTVNVVGKVPPPPKSK